MAVKQISDLTPTDRLRTGTQLELQDPLNGSGNITVDNLLAGIQWDITSQMAGYTAANIAEIEATHALRMHPMPDEANIPAAGWQIGRYMVSSSDFSNAATPFTDAYVSLTTTGPAVAPIMIFGWACASGICIPKKVTASLMTGAVSGTRAGACSLRMHRVYGLSTQVGSTGGSILSPGSQGGSGLGGLPAGTAVAPNQGPASLKSNQQPSQAHIQVFGSATVAAAQGFTDAMSMGIVESSVGSAAGNTPIQNKTLYDWQTAEQPLILTPATGFQINLDFPAAGTSQTIWHFITVQWDEWMPVAPGDR